MLSGFTLNGQHCSVLGVIMESKTLLILANSKDVYIDIPGCDGSYLFSGALSDAVIPINCGIKTANAAALMTAKRQIAVWVFSRQKVPLIFDDEPDKFYLVKYDGEIGLEKLTAPGMGKFTLVFRCSPLAYTAEVHDHFVNDAVVANNTGNSETPPVFTFTFTATATEIKVTLGAKYIRVVHNFAIADVLIVNCETGLVSINGIRAIEGLDWVNSDFFTLAPGNNSLTLLPASKCTAIVTYKPKWL